MHDNMAIFDCNEKYLSEFKNHCATGWGGSLVINPILPWSECLISHSSSDLDKHREK